MTANLREIKVFTTFPHRCSYLPEKEATTLFVDPRQTISPELYTELSLMGFRRSGDHIYRPHCNNCNACVAARVVASDFKPSKSQRRVINANQDLRLEITDSVVDDEAYELYERYISGKHADGDMYPPDRDQYESFLNNSLGATRYFRLYENDKLVCVAVSDEMLDGLAAIYTFYDPDLEKRSLGTFAVLLQISHAKRRGLPYVYLGYWIESCQKMNYKTRFKPLEMLVGGRWHGDSNTQPSELSAIPVVNIPPEV
ncbi:MAG: arginyltransferase [Proteobacteria bacterium]|nr:MAG: arginyltransferase [Pseudomonadota bacterium]